MGRNSVMNNVDFASYADDNTPFFVDKDLDDVISKLQNVSKTLFQWFNENQMKANPDKCHFICSSSKSEHFYRKSKYQQQC